MLQDGKYVVAWTDFVSSDALIQRLSADDEVLGGPFLARSTDSSRGSRPDLASDGIGNFIVVWARGDAGVDVPMEILRDGETMHVHVRSASRSDFFVSPKVH